MTQIICISGHLNSRGRSPETDSLSSGLLLDFASLRRREHYHALAALPVYEPFHLEAIEHKTNICEARNTCPTLDPLPEHTRRNTGNPASATPRTGHGEFAPHLKTFSKRLLLRYLISICFDALVFQTLMGFPKCHPTSSRFPVVHTASDGLRHRWLESICDTALRKASC
jgi:hypothetical protein